MSESTEDTYIKRVQFYMLLMIQTAVVAMFIATDHAAIASNKESVESLRVNIERVHAVESVVQEFKSFKENMVEFKGWASKTAEVSIADRAALRLELMKANELRYSIQQCTDGVKIISEDFKAHEKEDNLRFKKASQGR